MGVQFDRILDGVRRAVREADRLCEAAGRRDPRRAARRPATTSATSRTTASSRSTGCSRPAKTCTGSPTARWATARSTSPTSRRRAPILQKAATDLGVSFEAHGDGADRADGAKLRKLRIGLFDTYGGGMPVGLDALLLKNFEFPLSKTKMTCTRRCSTPAICSAKYDVLDLQRQPLGARRWRRSRRRRWRPAAMRRTAGDAAGWPRRGRRAERRAGAAAARRRPAVAAAAARGAQTRSGDDVRAPFVDYPEEFTQAPRQRRRRRRSRRSSSS